MAAFTSTNIANAITKLVAVDALPAIVTELVVGNLVRRDFEPTIAQCNDTTLMTLWGGGTKVAVLDRHIEATFQIPDVTKVLAVPDLLSLYMQPAVVALAEKIESDLLSLYSQFTANAAVGAPGAALTEAVIDSAETALFQAKVPASQPKYLVVDGSSYSVLRRMQRFSEYGSAGESGLRVLVDGPVGKIGNFYVFRSQFVPKTGSAPMTTHNVAFAKDALGLVVRRLPQPMPGTGAIAEYAELGNFGIRVLMNYQPNTLAQQFTLSILYGCMVAEQNFAVEVQS